MIEGYNCSYCARSYMIGVAINAVDPRQVLEREREDVSQSRERFVGERSTAAFGGEALHSATYCPGGSPR